MKGLEPSHLSIPEPKSGASTNFATPAQEQQFHEAYALILNKNQADY